MLLVWLLAFRLVYIDTAILLRVVHVLPLDCLQSILWAHSGSSVLISDPSYVLKCWHHLGVSVVKCLQL